MDETPTEQAIEQATEQATEQIGTPQVQTAFDRLQAGWKKDGGLSYKQRMKLLKGLARALRRHRDSLVAAIAADYGTRDELTSLVGEVFAVREMAKHARAHLRDWMEPEDVEVSIHLKPARARIVYQPLGVVGVIAPWNYPVQLSLAPMVGAIAAGNRVLLKSSTGRQSFEIPPKQAILLVKTPADQPLLRENDRLLCQGIVVDYRP